MYVTCIITFCFINILALLTTDGNMLYPLTEKSMGFQLKLHSDSRPGEIRTRLCPPEKAAQAIDERVRETINLLAHIIKSGLSRGGSQ